MYKTKVIDDKLVVTIEVDSEMISRASFNDTAIVVNAGDALKSIGDSLLTKNERGLTLIDKMLDDALIYAIKNGLEGIDPIEDDERSEGC